MRSAGLRSTSLNHLSLNWLSLISPLPSMLAENASEGWVGSWATYAMRSKCSEKLKPAKRSLALGDLDRRAACRGHAE